MDVKFLKNALKLKKDRIQARLQEFQALKQADHEKLFEELSFCVLTANTSAKMSLKSMIKIKPVLTTGTQEQLVEGLTGTYRYPNKRSEYIMFNRNFLEENNTDMRKIIDSFPDIIELRDYIAKNMKGIGYKESSHFLRNIGYEGLCILDKHILNSLVELNVLNEATAPKNRDEYLEIEKKMQKFAKDNNLNVDELDLLLWSLKTGEILK